MRARELDCEVLDLKWLTPAVISLKFKPKKPFRYEPGQFISLFVPPVYGTSSKPVKRAYTLASSPDLAVSQGYELCVKFAVGGKGSTYLKSLRRGDEIRISAPYGDFYYHPPKAGRAVCLISTGTGIAPFRAILESRLFEEHPPERTLAIFGFRSESEILYRELDSRTNPNQGTQVIWAVSRPENSRAPGIFQGRVTDYLKQLSRDWPWHTTDFYLCGNGEMIKDVTSLLVGTYGVLDASIRREAF